MSFYIDLKRAYRDRYNYEREIQSWLDAKNETIIYKDRYIEKLINVIRELKDKISKLESELKSNNNLTGIPLPNSKEHDELIAEICSLHKEKNKVYKENLKCRLLYNDCVKLLPTRIKIADELIPKKVKYYDPIDAIPSKKRIKGLIHLSYINKPVAALIKDRDTYRGVINYFKSNTEQLKKDIETIRHYVTETTGLKAGRLLLVLKEGSYENYLTFLKKNSKNKIEGVTNE